METVKFLFWRTFQAYIAIGLVLIVMYSMFDKNRFIFDLRWSLLAPVAALVLAIPFHVYEYKKGDDRS